MTGALNSWWKAKPRVNGPRARPHLEWLERRITPAGIDPSYRVITPVFDAALQAHDTQTLSTVNSVDLYAVTLQAGEAVVADALASRPGPLSPALRIFDANGRPLTPLDSQAGSNPELTFSSSAGGVYYFGVSSAGNLSYDPTKANSGSGGTTTGTFTLDLTRLTAVAERGSTGTAQALAVDTNLSGAVPPGAVDTYQLTIASAGRLRLALTPTDGTTLAPTLRLLDGSGALLIESDQRAPGDPTAYVDQHVEAGTYFVEVSASRSRGVAGVGRVYQLTTRFDAASAPFTTISVGELPFGAAVADVNGDGRPDLITTNRNSGTVSVALGNGDGTFGPVHSFFEGSYPYSVAVRDLNGDGHADLVVTNVGDNTVSVLLGKGDGTFGPATSYSVGYGPYSVAVADLNGDGIPDIVTADRYSYSVSVLLGNGDGTFGPVQSFSVGSDPISVAVKDLNGDGVPDLVTADRYTQVVSVLLGNGDGTFGGPQFFQVGSDPRSVALADVNGDGIPDVITANVRDDTVSVALGNGNGTFGSAQAYAVGNGPYSVTVGDVNGDGRPDILATSTVANTVNVFLGKGDGSFQTARPVSVGSGPMFVAVADVNGDDRADIVAVNTGSQDVSVLLGNGDGTFQAEPGLQAGKSPGSVLVRDVNGDGIPDLITADDASDTVSVILGNGNGTFGAARSFAVGSEPRSVVIADLNGDGRPDLISVNYDSQNSSILLGNGDGTFQKAQTIPVGGFPEGVTVVDINHDGRLDLVVTTGAGRYGSVFLGNGDGTFQKARPFDMFVPPKSIVVKDINGDGIPDIVTANGIFDSVTVLLGKGDGTFGKPLGISVGKYVSSVVVADVNGDGIPDLVLADGSDDAVSVLLGKGDGNFGRAQAYAAGGPGYSVVVSDLNGDGRPDLIVSNRFSSTVSVLSNNGGGTFGAAKSFATGGSPSSLFVQDLNGDGRPDIVALTPGNNTVNVLSNNGDGTFGGPRTFAVGNGPYSAAVQDVNGDGKLDLVVANATSNSLTVLLNTGTSFTAPNPDSNIPSSDAPVLVDLNGDHLLDALSINSEGQILFRQGTGNPLDPYRPFVVLNPGHLARDFTVVQTAGLPEIADLDRSHDGVILYRWSARSQTFSVGDSVITGTNPVRIASADLNSDGLGDLVIGNDADHTVTIAFQSAGGRFDTATLTRDVGDGPSSITFAKLGGTGTDIVVSGQVSGDVTILSSDANGPFDHESRFRAGLGLFDTVTGPTGTTVVSNQQTVGAVAVGADLVALNELTNDFTVLRPLGGGSFIDPQPGDVYALGAAPVQAIAGYFLHSSTQDLAVLTTAGDGTSRILVYLPDGNGNFGTPLISTAGQGATGFSYDKDTDQFVVGNAYGDFLTLTGDGHGVYAIDRGSLVGEPLAVGKTADGRSFVVVADQSEDKVQVYYRKSGTSQFAAPTTIDSSATDKTLLAPGAVQLIDLNKDGIPDLVVASRLGNDILVYHGKSDGTFDAPTSFPVGFEPVAFTAAYLKGTNVLDLAVANQGSNDVSVLDGSLDANGHWVGTAGPRLNSGGSEPLAVQAGDFSHNGIQDLRVTNSGGQIATLPGIGSAGTGTGFFQDASVTPAALGGTITGQVVDPITGREFVVSNGQISVFNGTSFSPVATPGFVTTLGVAGGLLVAGFADGTVGLLTEEGALLDRTAAFADQPSALQALQDGNSVDVYLTLDGSTVPVFVSLSPEGSTVPAFVSLLIPVVTELPVASAEAQATGIAGGQLVLVATLVTGGLQEGTPQDIQAAETEASFTLFLPPVRVSVAAPLPGQPAEEAAVTLVVRLDSDGLPPTAEFKQRVRDALLERLRNHQVFDGVEDLMDAVRRVLEPFRGPSKSQTEEPPAFFEFERAGGNTGLDRVAEAVVAIGEYELPPTEMAAWPAGMQGVESPWCLGSTVFAAWLGRPPAEQGGQLTRRSARGRGNHD